MNFQIETFQNPYLPAGTTRVDAVLTVTATTDGIAPLAASSGNTVVGLIIDCSGSMQGARMEAVRQATRQAIHMLRENMYFFVVKFSSSASIVHPLSPANAQNKTIAERAIYAVAAGGGTAMSTGLELARAEFSRLQGSINEAIFLTDGKNDNADEIRLDGVLHNCEGVFQCECRGVGTDWQVKQLQKIASRLLGSAQLIAEPSDVEADFAAAIGAASNRGAGNVRLRLWTPKTSRIVAVKQMSPEIALLTDRGTPVDAQSTDYPLGAWGAESRDYYVALEVNSAGEVGEEMLAARPSIVFDQGGATQEAKSPAARVLLSWTADESLSARINPQVAHYTGQEELAQAIQDGMEARAAGNTDAATRLLGKAAKLAAESGNDETTSRLKKVVDIVDERAGTVRLRQTVKKADEMDLDLGSTRTARAKRPAA